MIKKLDLGYLPAQTDQEANSSQQNPTTAALTTPKIGKSTVVTAQADAAGSSSEALQPNIPKDFDLFLNLVDFCKTVLPTTCTEFFHRWVYISFLFQSKILCKNSFD